MQSLAQSNRKPIYSPHDALRWDPKSLFLLLSKIPLMELSFCLILSFLFKILFTPDLAQMGPYSLVTIPGFFETLEAAAGKNPFSLLLPLFYPEAGREYWWTTSLIPYYLLNKAFSPFVVYIITSSTLIIVSYVCGWMLLRSRVFCCILGVLFALGTQLSYALTYGLVLIFFLLLSYISINLTACIHILKSENPSWKAHLFFGGSLIFCLLGFEMCLNYVGSLILGLCFITLWAHHHNQNPIKKSAIRLIAITVLLLGVYLLIQCCMRSVTQYLKPGCEEEVIFTHRNLFYVIDDLIINFFTFLYMSLSNYLPSFLFFSNSVTYSSMDKILAAQNGYHPSHTHLAYMSYLLQWRFYAGILATLFFISGFKWMRAAWNDDSKIHALVLSVLFIAIITGFSTHLVIKVRPYNITPMIGYKALFSTFAFTVMLAYIGMMMIDRVKSTIQKRRIFVSIFLVALLAALTRPTAMNAGLTAGGLVGYGDPVKKITKAISKLRKDALQW